MTAIDVVKLFRTAGDGRAGETVTHLEHALQCAALARRDRTHHHGRRGAELLRPFVPARVAWLVEHRVVAKRYLCTVDPRCATRLSPASARSLAQQGVRLETEERLSLETQPWFADAVT